MIGRNHIAPHRLADAMAGQMSARESVRIERHLADCERCSAAREIVIRARAAMTDISVQAAPELGWDHIGVRVYWSTSSARHAALRGKQRSWWRRPSVLAAVGALGLAAAAGTLLSRRSHTGAGETDRAQSSAPGARGEGTLAIATPNPPEPARLAVAPPLRGMVTFASGEVSIDGGAPRAQVDDREETALFASAIGEGAHLRTGQGRLVVQFGQASGFALTPRSSLRVTRFDDRVVELAVDEGAVEVEVSRRRLDQSLVVVAGRHRVSVLGTAFQVAHRGGHLDVECARGRVVVSDGASDVPLAAGEQLQVLEQSLLGRALRRAIDQQRLALMERNLARPLLPAWTASAALFDTSSMVDVAAPAGRAVRLDGVQVGVGSFALRVMSGRHHVEVADAQGGFERGAWLAAEPRARHHARAGVDGVVRILRAGEDGQSASVAGAVAERAPGKEATSSRAAHRLRKRQLHRVLDGSARARQCVRSLEKRDLMSGSFVVFDIGINGDGSQGHLNVVKSSVPPDVERCLRAVVDEVELPHGPQASVRFTLAF